MTYIEFFDPIASENVAACLTYAPDRVIYIGDQSKVMKRHIAAYTKVFEKRKQKIEFLPPRTVSKTNLERAIEVLQDIVDTYDDCVFDLTGGDEILNLALGVVYARNPEKNIKFHRFILTSNTIHDCDQDGQTIFHHPPALTVEENVRIYGGDILYGSVDERGTYRWELTNEFLWDLDRMWKLCKDNPRYWNSQIGLLEQLEEVGKHSEDGLTTVASCEKLEEHMKKKHCKYRKAGGLLDRLVHCGLLKDYTEENDVVTRVTYKNPQVRRCLSKAGQVLELMIFNIAKNLREEDGSPVYQDVLNGVLIDWDGVFHDEDNGETVDTENEVDVLLMHDMIPVFISCKNGYVNSDELYKLDSVASRFGGRYAKKLLVTTVLDELESAEYLRQRAKDMGIILMENPELILPEELERKLSNLWRS